MKKFLDSPDGASRGAALIIVLAFVVLATALSRGTIARAVVTSPDVSCSFIASAQIVNAGNFYKVGDNLNPVSGTLCSPADNYGFRLQVAAVGSNGSVTALTIVAGIGYSNPPSNPIVFAGSPTGSGFTANCTFN